MERVVALDSVGIDEAWFGEHHFMRLRVDGVPGSVHRAAAGADQST